MNEKEKLPIQEIAKQDFAVKETGELIEEGVKRLTREQIELAPEWVEAWRALDNLGGGARKSRKVLEYLTSAKQLLSTLDRAAVQAAVKEQFHLEQITSASLRPDQMLALLAAESLGLEPPSVSPEVGKIYQALKNIKTPEGEVNAVELLTSPHVNLAVKRDWLELQLLPRLDWLSFKDRQEAKELPPPEEQPQPDQLDQQPDIIPPPDTDKMETLEEHAEKGEGEPHPYFTITPFYGGYYKGQTFDSYNPETREWFGEKAVIFNLAQAVEVDEKTIRVKQGLVHGGVKTRLYLPYNFAFLPETLKVPTGVEMQLLADEEGNYLIDATNVQEAVVPFSIEFGRRLQELTHKEPVKALTLDSGKLAKETQNYLDELKADSVLSKIEKARKLKSWVKNNLEYSTQFSYNNFQEVEAGKKADCDTANTYYLGLLSRLGLEARMARGHYVKVKDNQGRAVISASTGHAWAEVWDEQARKWVRLDATPKGADYMDEEEMDEKEEDRDFEGDFGEIEAEVLSDEEIQELIDQAKERIKEAEKRRQDQEKPELIFAKEAGCSEQEAKEILAQINQTRELKDKKGRNILNLLTQEFQKIIKANLKEVPSYRAPVRMSEGDELVDPVEAVIDIKTGSADPTGFKRREIKQERVPEYGGFDVIVVADKSGSMSEGDSVTGQLKYKEQQKFVFLIQDALYRFARDAKMDRIKLLNPLDVRTCLVSFRAEGANVELPLTDAWSSKEQYQVWKSLGENVGGGTPDHLGLAVAEKIIKQDTQQKGIKENVIIVEGVGLTQAAREIEATYYPQGKCLKSVAEAPEWVAGRIIAVVQKFYPEKTTAAKVVREKPTKRLRLVIITADGGSDSTDLVTDALLDIKLLDSSYLKQEINKILFEIAEFDKKQSEELNRALAQKSDEEKREFVNKYQKKGQ